jgi:hypothetical protein
MMGRLAVRYPQYGWERNQGYATQEHRAAIRAHGLTPHHRRSFQALHVLLAGDQLGLFDGAPVMEEDRDEADELALDVRALDAMALDALAAAT